VNQGKREDDGRASLCSLLGASQAGARSPLCCPLPPCAPRTCCLRTSCCSPSCACCLTCTPCTTHCCGVCAQLPSLHCRPTSVGCSLGSTSSSWGWSIPSSSSSSTAWALLATGAPCTCIHHSPCRLTCTAPCCCFAARPPLASACMPPSCAPP